MTNTNHSKSNTENINRIKKNNNLQSFLLFYFLFLLKYGGGDPFLF